MYLQCSWSFPTVPLGQCLDKVIYHISECRTPKGTFILPSQKQVEVWSFMFMIIKYILASEMRDAVVFSVNSSITLTSELLNSYYLMKIINFKWETNLKYGYTIRGLPVTGNKNQIIWALPSKMRVSKKEICNFRVIIYDEILEGISLYLGLC